MAHLIKRPDSELWWGSFTGADGRRIRRSTGTSDKAVANAILVGWEKAAREGRKKVLTESRVRRTMNDILEQFTGAALSCPSVADYFRDWIESKKEEKAQKTVLKYIQTANHFLSALGAKTQLPMEAIGAADIRIWREALPKEGCSGTTVNARKTPSGEGSPQNRPSASSESSFTIPTTDAIRPQQLPVVLWKALPSAGPRTKEE